MNRMRAESLYYYDHAVTDLIMEKYGRIDVLLVPVGGFYTIGPEEAAKLVKTLRPRLAIPMHYRGEGFGYDVIGPVQDFTECFEQVQCLDSNVLDPADAAAPVVVLRCPV